jgi:hypothetical protein
MIINSPSSESQRLRASPEQRLSELTAEKKKLKKNIDKMYCFSICFAIIAGYGFSIFTGIAIGVKMICNSTNL